jgi:hypothetical protein
MGYSESEIITAVDGAEINRERPQTTAIPRFMTIRTQAGSSQLDVRITLDAAPKLAEAVMTQTRDVQFHAQEIAVNLRKDDALLTVVNPDQAMSITLSRGALEKLQNRIVDLLKP